MVLLSTCSADRMVPFSSCQQLQVAFRIGDHGLDPAHCLTGVEIELGFGKRHENVIVVVQRVADVEAAHHVIGLDARRGAEGRDIALWCNECDVAAQPNAQPPRQAIADDDVLAGEIFQCVGRQLLDQHRHVGEVGSTDAAHRHAGIGAVLAGHHLAVHYGRGAHHARHGADARCDGVIVGQVAHLRLDRDVA
jgi:hypothetical protein